MRPPRQTSLLAIALILLLGAMLRLYFYHYWSQVNGDSLVYGDIAKNWMLHGTYGRTFSGNITTIRPTLIRLPGYPVFLVLCFSLFGMEHYHAVLLLQIAIDLVTCLLIAYFAYSICSRRAAWVALVLGALCPFTANYCSAALTETLSLFFITLSMLSLRRILTRGDWISALACGASWSCLTLLRPDGALLPAAFLPTILWYSRKPILGRSPIGLRRALQLSFISALLAALPFAAWTIRNWRTFHTIQPFAPRYANDPGEPTNPGFNRWTRTWAAEFTSTYEIYWNVDSDIMPFNALPSRAFDSPRQKQQTASLFAVYNQNTNLTPELDTAFATLAADRVHSHPLRYYLALPFLRVTDMWLRPRTEMLNVELRWWQYHLHHIETEFAAGYAALNLAYLIAAAFGIVRLSRLGDVRFLGAMLAYLLLRNILLGTIESPESRYTIEGFPMIIAWAAIAFSRCGGETVASTSVSSAPRASS